MQATTTTGSQLPRTRRTGRCRHAIRPRRQRGVVLAVGLIILVVMTLLGVTAMRSSTVEEIMAGNLKDRNVAFQGTEAGLRAGEAALNGGATAASTALPNPAVWDGQSPAPTATVSTGDWPAAPHQAPVYHLGPAFEARLPGEITYGTHESAPRTIYPVTAYSEGATGSAAVVLQSYFEPW